MIQVLKLNYGITKNVFYNEDDYKKALQAVKSKTITVNDIKLLIDSKITSLYNSIVSHCYGSNNPNSNDIWKRDKIESYIEHYEPRNAYLFPILKNNGLIGVCGRGYTLDHERIIQSDDDYNRIIHIMFELMIVL